MFAAIAPRRPAQRDRTSSAEAAGVGATGAAAVGVEGPGSASVAPARVERW